MPGFFEAVDEAIAPHIPGRGASREALFAAGQSRKILAEVTTHARFINGFRHLRQSPRAPRFVAGRLPRPALTLTRGVPPITVDVVALPAHRVHDALAAGSVVAVAEQRSRGAFEVGQVQLRPRGTVANRIAFLIRRDPSVKLESDLGK